MGNVRNDAKLYEKGILTESDDFSVRGLENKTRMGARNRRANRMNAYAAVFFEIECQEQDYYSDDEAIAYAYREYSEPCQSDAEEMGRRDADLCRDDDHNMNCDNEKMVVDDDGKDWAEYFRAQPLNIRAGLYEQATAPSVIVS